MRRFDHDGPQRLADALQDVRHLLLISSNDVARRVEQHRAVIAAAAQAGVEFMAYTSVLHAETNILTVAPSQRATGAMLKASGIPYAASRNGW